MGRHGPGRRWRSQGQRESATDGELQRWWWEEGPWGPGHWGGMLRAWGDGGGGWGVAGAQPALPVVDPVVQLQETQLRAALFQAQPQLLHVSPTVVHGTVAPGPDPAGEGAVSGPALPPPPQEPRERPLCSPQQVWRRVGPCLRAVVGSTAPANPIVACAEGARGCEARGHPRARRVRAERCRERAP